MPSAVQTSNHASRGRKKSGRSASGVVRNTQAAPEAKPDSLSQYLTSAVDAAGLRGSSGASSTVGRKKKPVVPPSHYLKNPKLLENAALETNQARTGGRKRKNVSLDDLFTYGSMIDFFCPSLAR
jgi:hypothetical protein